MSRTFPDSLDSLKSLLRNATRSYFLFANDFARQKLRINDMADRDIEKLEKELLLWSEYASRKREINFWRDSELFKVNHEFEASKSYYTELRNKVRDSEKKEKQKVFILFIFFTI